MSSLVADTHAMVWYLLSSDRISPKAMAAFDETLAAGDPVFLPSICLVEIIYLVEKGRLPKEAFARLNIVLSEQDSGYKVAPLDLDTTLAIQRIPREAVPDMPDRIVAATALFLNLPLVTKDKKIGAAGIATIW
jgi:PIN domain nuclease of toxin-antitoxin system